MKAQKLLASLAAGCALSGCTSMSGLDSQSSFSCKAPAGVSCQSISGVYANSLEDNLPFQRRGAGESTQVAPAESLKGAGPTLNAEGKVSPRDMDAISSGVPIRQAPLVLRVWMAPYEDDAGDLHDQSYFYTMVHTGKWMIEANRAQIGNQFRPVFPLRQKGPSSDPKDPVAGPLGQKHSQQPGPSDARRLDSTGDGLGGQD